MANVTESAVLGALSRVMDPDLNRDIVSLGFVQNLEIDRNRVSFDVELTTPACPVKDQLKQQCIDEVAGLGAVSVSVNMTARVRNAPVAGKELIPGIHNLLAVASGKGGVGKSTVAMNLALALSQAGARVGLLDCDFYGPSVPSQIGNFDRVQANEQRRMLPHEFQGIKVLSMGFMVERNQAVVWRGPMLHKVLTQFLFQTEWGGLDYLVLDLPPGTGDVQLSLAQSTPVSAAVLVTTPQDVALKDVEKGLRMFQSVNVPVLGVIENMSYYKCGNCDKKHYLFGKGGAARIAKGYNIPVLGEIPMDPNVQGKLGDGQPLLARRDDSEAAQAFRAAAGRTAARLSVISQDWAVPGPGAMEV
ncbi:MAG: Mrp/NBP35 family ATP-binding protein [Acidobacteriota bacterium]|nr:Mrp/NBP35 family ATP-binding protein [Acidobacteriota bacterium]